MASGVLHGLALVVRMVALVVWLTLFLVGMYGLYIAAALAPRGTWRRRMEFRLHRRLFAIQHLNSQPPSR